MKFGVLGDAKIAREKLLPAIRAAGHEVAPLGRRAPSGGADPVWGDVRVSSYEEMLADQDIDAVYNPLPNHLHVPMSIAALEAGKPVICEKPVALSVEELDRLLKQTIDYRTVSLAVAKYNQAMARWWMQDEPGGAQYPRR